MTDQITPDRVRAERHEITAAQPPPPGKRWALIYDFPTGERQDAQLVDDIPAQQRLDNLFDILRDVFHQMLHRGAGVEALLLRIRQLEANFILPLLDEPGGFFPDPERPASSEVQALLHDMYRRHQAGEQGDPL
jgi:hypothetical protein